MRAQATFLTLAPLLAVLVACGPIPVDQAEQVCLRDAELAQRPRGNVALGVGSGSGGGTRSFGRIEVEMSGDYLMNRDPAQVFDRCVMSRSGQPPRQGLAQQPGWRGRG
ncbi:hypothetical protein [Paracoccus sp. (in: a-proteobacteria)]|uniref:hypothetical protein n=1 Tax=Paracoccus sp. TaxID=267 RepID=UPI00396CF3F7